MVICRPGGTPKFRMGILSIFPTLNPFVCLRMMGLRIVAHFAQL